jgi:hypothetical protein
MRILKVSDVYFPRVNGVSTSIETFRRDLTALGHEVVLVAPAYDGTEPVARAGSDPSIRRVPARAVPRDPEDRIMSFRGLRRTLAELSSSQFDVVHIHTPFLAHYAALRCAKMQRVPVVGFAQVVRDLLADRGACRALGEEARRYAQTCWASAAMAQRLSALYASLGPARTP